MKMNKRLTALAEMVLEPYEVVWDCCCDHGLLGMKVLASGRVKQVFFVDVVPDILDKLKNKLITYGQQFPVHVKWEILCCDAGSVNLSLIEENIDDQRQISAKQLVIISGVGGDLLIDMLERIVTRNRGLNIDYLLCPVQHTYKVRAVLKKLKFKLKREQLIIDNNRGYEMLLVNQHQGVELTLTGNTFWEKTVEHQDYLEKLIDHYQRIKNSRPQDEVLNISALKEYRNLYHKYYSTEK